MNIDDATGLGLPNVAWRPANRVLGCAPRNQAGLGDGNGHRDHQGTTRGTADAAQAWAHRHNTALKLAQERSQQGDMAGWSLWYRVSKAIDQLRHTSGCPLPSR
jgi:hypothetical protein